MNDFTSNLKNLIKSVQGGDSDALLLLLRSAEPELETIVESFTALYEISFPETQKLTQKVNAAFMQTIHKFNADDETALHHYNWYVKRSIEMDLEQYCERHYGRAQRYFRDELFIEDSDSLSDEEEL